jgi:uncharacterized delta-60 repeat protein
MKSKLGMGLRGRATIGSALVALPLLVWACGDDSNTTTGAGGTGGATGGSAGTGGNAGTTGGSAGSTAGAAGSAAGSGGAAGSAGAGGKAGAAGSGGAAGSAGAGGKAGAAGSAGSAGAGGAADAGRDVMPPPGPAPQIVTVSATGHDRFYGVAHDAAGNIFATGQVSDSTAGDFETLLVKFLPTGAKDPSFGTGGVVRYNATVGGTAELARGIVVQSTGKIVVSAIVDAVGGDSRDRETAVMRFNTNGSIDTTFGVNGVRILHLSNGDVGDAGTANPDGGTTIVPETTWGLNLFPNDDMIVVGGRRADGRTDLDFTVTKLKADGTIDTSYATNGTHTLDIPSIGGSPKTGAVLPDGSVVGCAYMNNNGQVPVIWKLTPTGQLDTTFGTNGVFSQAVLAAATEAYGAVLQGTNFVTNGYGRANTSESLDFVSLRVTAAGALDPTYGTAGVTRIDVGGFADNGRGLVVLPDNRVMLIGGGRPTANDVDGVVAVLSPDGQPDTTFGAGGFRAYDLGGVNDFLWAGSVAPDKKSVAVVGIKSAPAATDAGPTGNDDAAILVLPLP